MVRELDDGATITVSYRWDNETYRTGAVVFVTTYVAPGTPAPGGDVNTDYRMVAETRGNNIIFNVFEIGGPKVTSAGTVHYEYTVEILNGGIWVETTSGSGDAIYSASSGNFAFASPVNVASNSSDLRITITASNNVIGTVEYQLVINAK